MSDYTLEGVDKEAYLTAIHFSRQYPTLLEKIRSKSKLHSMRYEKEIHKKGGYSDPVFNSAAYREGISKKIQLIEQTAKETAPDVWRYLLQGVGYGFTFEQLKAHGLPYERDAYYNRRRKYYLTLADKIGA